MFKIFIAILFALFAFPFQLSAEPQDRIQQAVDVVQSLCLSGTEYGISVDAEGVLSIKKFKPNGAGSISLSVWKGVGEPELKDELKIIANKDIRECTSKHIGRILDAILEAKPQGAGSDSPANSSIKNATYIGFLPGELTVLGFVEGREGLYYRFSVNAASKISIGAFNNSKDLKFSVLSENEKEILGPSLIKKGRTEFHKSLSDKMFYKGEYYIKINCSHKNEASSYKIIVRGS